MRSSLHKLVLAFFILLCAFHSEAQVYSPSVLKKGQVDATNLRVMARDIFAQAGATTPREKAEAIWRFFLTDGRFVKPGFWYHIAGWAYEEPLGEVLDPIKLMNSYGFGLCYQIAPLLADLWEAGGFEHARVWFLTGHTVAEVFYDGAYHHFDSDMMGYNTLDTGPLKQRPVASVHQLEKDASIILAKLTGPKQVNRTAVDDPWYPADVRADEMDGLAKLFTTTDDNWLYAFERAPQGHTMDFVLRPGERMTRYFQPETEGDFYLPEKFDGTAWKEFPEENARYDIRTQDGPKSQKDTRRWSTGVIEYRPPAPKSLLFDMPCPYVIIDSSFAADVHLERDGDKVIMETSVDGGRTWTPGTILDGPFHGRWTARPAVVVKSAHGTRSAVSGFYGYLVRFRLPDSDSNRNAKISNIALSTRFQLNPRTLPEMTLGRNEFQFRSSHESRTVLPLRADQIESFTSKAENVRYIGDGAQGYLVNNSAQNGELLFEVPAGDGRSLTGFDVGGRFLDLRDGLAPDKFTAEVRKVAPWPAKNAPAPAASISWALTAEGPYKPVWTYDPKLTWKDGQTIDRTLRWPEVDRHVGNLPSGTRRVYVRYQVRGMAIDDFRLAAISPAAPSSSTLQVTHMWRENNQERKHVQLIDNPALARTYMVQTSATGNITNEAVVLECMERVTRQE
jgi:hypothetical protein